MGGFVYVLGVPNFANYEATAALVRVPREGGAIDYVSVGEERLARVKHTYAFPLRGIHYCLEAFGLESLREIDFIYTDYARLPRWLNSGPGYRKLEHDYLKLRLDYPVERIRIADHHDAHAASAFYPSPFDEAAVLIVDSLGSRLNTQTLYHFDGRSARTLERGDYWGIGRIYSLVTGAVLPYGPEKGFGKTMGLAPYGRVHPGPVLDFRARDEGMSSDYSAFASRPPLPRIVAPGVRRCEDRERVLDPYFARAAYDVQQECERQMLRMARYAHERTGSRNVCIAGGVALNGLSNARVMQEGPFDGVWVPPACSDTGLSLGLALWGYYQEVAAAPASPRVTFSMPTAYSGRVYPRRDVAELLDRFGVTYEPAEPAAVAAHIANGKVVGWFEGGSESGPRALGHRSILADPRDPSMKDTLNQRVKFREGYRPYAPSVMAEHAAAWFELPRPSLTPGAAPDAFMLYVVPVRADKQPLVPAITHVDGTTRPQTVTEAANPNYYRMISEFHRLTGVPLVLNTSLNVNREPIVETPIDALICAFGTAIDVLYIEGLLVECRSYANPEMVKRLMAERAAVLDAEWERITAKYLTAYDTRERDAFLAEANTIAEWHRSYRSKSALEDHIDEWCRVAAKLLIVGTRAHTRCLYEHLDRFGDLRVGAFVPLDDLPGERGEFRVYPEQSLDRVDWRDVDAVLISTHEYQHATAARVRAAAPAVTPIVTLYDDAGDSLLHVLPGKWPVVRQARGVADVPARPPAVAFDIESQPAPGRLRERYALIVSYHYCHPRDGFLRGTKSLTPEEFDGQLRILKQNFTCTTVGALMAPGSDLPETVAVVTFDDGFKDVADHALPLLKRWDIPATIYCNSAPVAERRLLDVHRVHLLQARLGNAAFRDAFRRAVDAHPGLRIEPTVDLHLENLYPYDDDETRRFKRLLNFDVPYPTVRTILREIFEKCLGADDEFVEHLYLSADDVRRCQDAGLEIGIHGEQHLTLSRLTEQEQRQEIEQSAAYFSAAFDLDELHFSYPYGAVGTWNETTKSILQSLGFASAVTKIRTIVKPSHLSARWEIPRFDCRDVFDAANHLAADQLQALFTAD
jgi:carbamoyltransferase